MHFQSRCNHFIHGIGTTTQKRNTPTTGGSSAAELPQMHCSGGRPGRKTGRKWPWPSNTCAPARAKIPKTVVGQATRRESLSFAIQDEWYQSAFRRPAETHFADLQSGADQAISVCDPMRKLWDDSCRLAQRGTSPDAAPCAAPWTTHQG